MVRISTNIITIESIISFVLDILMWFELEATVVTEVLVPNRRWNDGLILNKRHVIDCSLGSFFRWQPCTWDNLAKTIKKLTLERPEWIFVEWFSGFYLYKLSNSSFRWVFSILYAQSTSKYVFDSWSAAYFSEKLVKNDVLQYQKGEKFTISDLLFGSCQ